MTAANEGSEPRTVTPAEIREIIRAFGDSDLRELRLAVGDVDLLISRNEQVDGATASRPAPPPAAAAPRVSRPAEPVHEARQEGKEAAAGNVAPPAEKEAEEEPDRSDLAAVRAPAVGVFYRRPAPDKAPYVEVGSKVAAGDPVGTIEVMKMFTTVTTDEAGTIAEICADDAQLVEYQQVLMYVSAEPGNGTG